jgi:hypothetical protein
MQPSRARKSEIRTSKPETSSNSQSSNVQNSPPGSGLSHCRLGVWDILRASDFRNSHAGLWRPIRAYRPARGTGAASEGIVGGLMMVTWQPHHEGFSASHWHPGTFVANDSRRLDGAKSLLGVQIRSPGSDRVHPPWCMGVLPQSSKRVKPGLALPFRRWPDCPPRSSSAGRWAPSAPGWALPIP